MHMHQHSIITRRFSGGFSLVELLVVMAVVGIVAAWAMPSFQGIIRNNRVTPEAANLKVGLMLARSEAIKRNRRVAICSSSDGASCTGAWNDGWIVFVDTDADSARANTEELIRVGQSDDDISIASSEATTVCAINARRLP